MVTITGFPEDAVVLCPQCGADVAGFSEDVDLVEVYETEPLWPGGPVVQTSLDPVAMRPINRRITFHPCDHTLPTEGLTITAVKRP